MGKHVLDRSRRRKAEPMDRYVRYDRRMLLVEDDEPVSRALLRRAKGPMNDSLRMRAFLRIDRGQTA